MHMDFYSNTYVYAHELLQEHIRICIRTFTGTHICTYMDFYRNTYVHLKVFTHTKHVYSYIHELVQTNRTHCLVVRVQVHVRTYIHLSMCTYVGQRDTITYTSVRKYV